MKLYIPIYLDICWPYIYVLVTLYMYMFLSLCIYRYVFVYLTLFPLEQVCGGPSDEVVFFDFVGDLQMKMMNSVKWNLMLFPQRSEIGWPWPSRGQWTMSGDEDKKSQNSAVWRMPSGLVLWWTGQLLIHSFWRCIDFEFKETLSQFCTVWL